MPYQCRRYMFVLKCERGRIIGSYMNALMAPESRSSFLKLPLSLGKPKDASSTFLKLSVSTPVECLSSNECVSSLFVSLNSQMTGAAPEARGNVDGRKLFLSGKPRKPSWWVS